MSNSITLNNSGQLQVTLGNTTPTVVTPATAAKLTDLSDVNITSVKEDERLVYDEVNKVWKNQESIDGGDLT